MMRKMSGRVVYTALVVCSMSLVACSEAAFAPVADDTIGSANFARNGSVSPNPDKNKSCVVEGGRRKSGEKEDGKNSCGGAGGTVVSFQFDNTGTELNSYPGAYTIRFLSDCTESVSSDPYQGNRFIASSQAEHPDQSLFDGWADPFPFHDNSGYTELCFPSGGTGSNLDFFAEQFGSGGPTKVEVVSGTGPNSSCEGYGSGSGGYFQFWSCYIKDQGVKLKISRPPVG